MIYWSIVVAVVGVVGTAIGTVRLERRGSDRSPELYWVLGLVAFLPAWMITVLALLGRMGGRFPDMSVGAWWILSGAAGMLGLIVGDAMVRRLRESGRKHPAARYWAVGIGTFAPAWGVALLGLVWT